MGNYTTDTKGDRLLKDYLPSGMGSLGDSVEPTQGGPADFHPPGGGTSAGEGGGGALGTDSSMGSDTAPDYVIIYADETSVVLTLDDIYATYDPDNDNHWNINFAVSTGGMTKVVSYGDDTDRYPDNGGSPAVQTFYRLPIVRDELVISSGGIYQEDTTCINGQGRQQLIKVG